MPHFFVCEVDVDPLELEKRISALVEGAGFHLLKAHWQQRTGRRLLKIVADAEDHNITVEECAQLSRLISDLLDSYPHEFPDYRLEVSSPGLDHPLEKWQFRKNTGRFVKVEYEEEGRALSYTGELISVRQSEIAVQGDGEPRHFHLDKNCRVLVLPRL